MTYVDWFNHRRFHGEITNDATYTTPAEFEAAYYGQNPTALEALTQQPEQSNPGCFTAWSTQQRQLCTAARRARRSGTVVGRVGASSPAAPQLSERLSVTPSGTGSTVDEMFHESSDRPLLALAEAGGGKRPAKSTLVGVCAGWHFITGQFHQSPVRDVEMLSEGAKYSRGWRFDLSSLELLEVCSRDTSGVCGGLERLTNLRSGVGKFTAELTRIPHPIFHRSDRTQ